MHRMLLVASLCVCSAIAISERHARAAQSETMDGERRVRLEFEAASGDIRARMAMKADRKDELQLPPVKFDGVAQTTFNAAHTGSVDDNRYENGRLRVELENVSVNASAITWTAVDGAAHDFEIAIDDNSAYYGCGERFSSLNHKGLILPMASIDHPEDKGSVSYKPVPFFMSTRGYAVWLDSAAPGEFDLNATDRQHVVLRFRAAQLRLVLIAGPDFAALLDEFTRLSGRARIPPKWAFAPWKSRDVHRDRDEVLADAELTRRFDLPGSVIVIDSPWETSYNNFVVNETQFRDHASMFARIRELGFYPVFWLTPFINVENVTDMTGIASGPASNYAEAVERGYLVKLPDGRPMLAAWWKGRGGLVDFTNPDARAWWQKQLDQTLRWGARGIKCDDGEGNFVQDAVFHDKTPAAEMKNRYALLYLQAAQEFIDTRLGGDGVLLARCGFTGTQQHPFCWAGDNEANFSFENGLPTAVLAGQNAALSGLAFWGHDIAGYMGRPDKELFIRWTQFGALSPLMMVHMQSNLGPWDFDEETLTIYRRFAKLHTGLFPYIYDAAHDTAATGMPIIRPMVLAFPGDADAARQRFQYMFGPELLVAPFVQPGTHRAVYFPKLADGADWVDWWTGRRYTGGATIEVQCPLERMPLFVRSGALISMLPEDVDTLIERNVREDQNPQIADDVVTLDSRRALLIWPGGDREIRTYDGISATMRTENRATRLTLSATAPRTLEIRRMFAEAQEPDWNFDDKARTLTRSIEIGPTAMTLTWPVH